MLKKHKINKGQTVIHFQITETHSAFDSNNKVLFEYKFGVSNFHLYNQGS